MPNKTPPHGAGIGCGSASHTRALFPRLATLACHRGRRPRKGMHPSPTYRNVLLVTNRSGKNVTTDRFPSCGQVAAGTVRRLWLRDRVLAVNKQAARELDTCSRSDEDPSTTGPVFWRLRAHLGILPQASHSPSSLSWPRSVLQRCCRKGMRWHPSRYQRFAQTRLQPHHQATPGSKSSGLLNAMAKTCAWQGFLCVRRVEKNAQPVIFYTR